MIRKVITAVKGESLYVNSLYIMASSVATAGLGFLFWLFSAHLYTPSQVGLASSLISAMGLISYVSLLGFNSTFIRYLPKSKKPNEAINTGLLLVLAAAIVTSAIYVALLPWIAPSLAFVHSSVAFGLGFIILCALAAINFVTDSIFVAYRSAKYNLIVYVVMGVIKLGLPAAFAVLGAYGLYMAAGAAALAGLLLSLYYMVRLFGYCLSLKVNRQVLREVFRFSFGNYVANLLNILPPLIIPLIIINRLGATQAGYYYMAFMVANLIYAASYSISQSLFAEGAHADKPFAFLVVRAGLLMGGISVVAGLTLFLLGKWLLLIFGPQYSAAVGALNVLSFAAPFVAVYILTATLLRSMHKTLALIIIHVVYFLSIVGLATAWSAQGLSGIASAWLIGHLLTGLLGIGAVFLTRKRA